MKWGKIKLDWLRRAVVIGERERRTLLFASFDCIRILLTFWQPRVNWSGSFVKIPGASSEAFEIANLRFENEASFEELNPKRLK